MVEIDGQFQFLNLFDIHALDLQVIGGGEIISLYKNEISPEFDDFLLNFCARQILLLIIVRGQV